MAFSPNLGEELAEELARATAEAEMAILRRISDSLAQGIDNPAVDYQKVQLANLQRVRDQALAELQTLNATASTAITSMLEEAYSVGTASVLADLGDLAEDLATVAAPATQEVLRAVATDLTQKVGGAQAAALRRVPDIYQQIIGEVVEQAILGSMTRKQAAQQAMDRLLGNGLTMGPPNSRGAQMNLTDYTTMAARTANTNAAVIGHAAAMSAHGLNFCVIQMGPRACDRCDRWANIILTVNGPAGTYTVENMVTGEPMQVIAVASLDQARAAGWAHPNCRCGIRAYIPGASKVPRERLAWDQAGYEAQQRQRDIERSIREWKTKEAIAIGDVERASARAKVLEWQAAQRQHLKENPFLKRQSAREQIGRPPAVGGGVPTPKPVPTPSGQTFRRVAPEDAPSLINRPVNVDGTPGPGWTERDIEVLNRYTGYDAQTVNKWLRSEFDTVDEYIEDAKSSLSKAGLKQARAEQERAKALSDEIGSVFAKDAAKINSDILLGRSETSLSNLLERVQDWDGGPIENLVGKTISNPGYLSTSVITDNSAFGGRIKILIETPAGSKGVWMGDLSTFQDEAEVLLDTGTQMKVLSVKQGASVADPSVFRGPIGTFRGESEYEIRVQLTGSKHHSQPLQRRSEPNVPVTTPRPPVKPEVPEFRPASVKGMDALKELPAEDWARLAAKDNRAGNWAPGTSVEDDMLATIWKDNGFDGLPRVIPSSEFKALAGRSDKNVIYRSLQGTDEQKAEWFDQLMYKDDPYAGLGFAGNGTYFGTTLEWSQTFGDTYIKAVINPNATWINARQMMDLQYEIMDYAKANNWPHIDAVELVVQDPGRLASLLGYDYIKATTYDEVIILNRSALIIEEGLN